MMLTYGNAGDGRPAVAVVVPMFNAARTIDETLASICSQTYASLEIVVVDDGSADDSAAIVEGWAALDERIRIINQQNSGVAKARNVGAAATTAPFLAFVDADDVWAPDKVTLQLASLRQSAIPALSYCWYAQIDEASRLLWRSSELIIEGDVVRELCRMNFVGNGSSMMMPRAIFNHVGGFDPSLRAAGAQGCEDLMFLLQVAEVYPFVCVPRHLVGYRQTHDNMSGDVIQMARSCETVLERVRLRHPQFAPEIEMHFKDLIAWLLNRAVIAGRVTAAVRLLDRLRGVGAVTTISEISDLARSYARAQLVPRWFKHWFLRPALTRLGRRRPLYTELTW